MKVSIVIPVLNEESKISVDINAAIKFFETQKISGAIIVVDDGSVDGTANTVHKYVQMYPGIVNLVSYQPNKGKGYAVRKGVLQAKGDIVMFADSGYCVPFSDALKGIELIKNKGIDIAHGSRFLEGSVIIVPRKWYRSLFSYVFRRLIVVFAQLPVKLTDTQCGFKMYKREVARELFSICQTDGFMFDIEIILRAEKRGYLIREFPIEWTTDHDSRVNIKKTIFTMMKELVKIKRMVG